MSHFTVVALVMLLASDSSTYTSSAAVKQSELGTRFVKTYWSRSGTVLLEDKDIKSLPKCALLCSQYDRPGTEECSGFRLAPDGPTCQLFTGTIPGVAYLHVKDVSKDVIYRKGKQCPLSKGYAVYSVNQSEFCLKAFWGTRVSGPSARSYCNQDGGNLVDLENQQKVDAIKQVYEATLTGPAPYSTWVGAYRSGKTFKSDATGLTPQNLNWAWGEPNNLNEKCVEMTKYMNLNDQRCQTKSPFLCEILM